ncbi:MAG: MarR family winged helix-turn-helix transcriptional regulator [Acidobacteriota bacterium]
MRAVASSAMDPLVSSAALTPAGHAPTVCSVAKGTRRGGITDDARSFYDGLRNLQNLAAQRDPRVVCEWGITITECHAMEYIAKAGPCTVNALAAHLRLDKSTTSRTVTSLVRKRLVHRAKHPQDGRAIHLVLTAKGTDVADAVLAANEQSYAEMLQRLPARECAQLIDALTKIVTLVKTLEPKPTTS